MRPRHIDQADRTGVDSASGPRRPAAAELRGQSEFAGSEERPNIARIKRWRANERMALLVGRAVFGGFFLFSGLHHFLQRKMLTPQAKSKGVPLPGLAVAGSGTLLVLGGLSLVTGVRPKIGASLIATFLLGVTPRMHDFWRIEDGERRMQEMVNFTKNVALIGGAALAAAVPEPWPARLQGAQRDGE